MNDVVRYILSFLLYGNESAIEQIAYVPELKQSTTHRLTIVGSGFTNKLHYPTQLKPEIEQLSEGRYVIHTDIVYNTFFFISRAEEILNPQRDEHGRFLAQFSMLSANDLQMALIDEYSRLVMKLLQLPLPQPGFSAVHLTHDIDTLALYRHLRGSIGGFLRGQRQQVLASWQDIRHDPVYTFPWMIKQDAECLKNAECRMHNAQCTMHNAECTMHNAQCTMHNAECDVIYFIKDTRGRGKDYPQYNLRGKDYLTTVQHTLNNGYSNTQLGLHSSSYETEPIVYHKDAFGINYHLHRSHYLACSINRMQQLIEAGVTDDYSMGFADRAGFRLQTTRAVRWINPLTLHLTPLTLHPLTIMDCTLSNANYMNLSEEEAYFYSAALIEKVREHHGELNLLWHNSVFVDSYHSTLYPRILSLI